MTTEPLGILTDIIAAIAVMFIFPLMCTMQMKESLEDRYVRGITRDMTDTVCTVGGIDEALYEAYISKLSGVGAGRNIRITERITRYEPVYEDGIFTGSIIAFDEVRGTEEILDMIYSPEGFRCVRDASIRIEVSDGKNGFVSCSGIVTGKAKP